MSLLIPKKVKYRKWHTMRKNAEKVGVASRGTTVAFGSYGLKALEGKRILSNQIDNQDYFQSLPPHINYLDHSLKLNN